MENQVKGPGAFVQRVRQDTQRYVQDLLDENEKLRCQIVGLEDHAGTLKRRMASAEDELRLLRAELTGEREEHEGLRHRLEEVQGQSRTFSERYVQVEQQNTDLANLYVAGYRLHGTLDREDVLAAIQEIIINLVGCEELAIFEIDSAGSRLQLVSSFGIDTGVYQSVSVGSGLIGAVAHSGEAYLVGKSDTNGSLPLDAHLTACIPLSVDGRVTGAIAMFQLLPQKEEGLGMLDYELLDLLSAQAGVALYCTALHAQSAAPAAALEA